MNRRKFLDALLVACAGLVTTTRALAGAGRPGHSLGVASSGKTANGIDLVPADLRAALDSMLEQTGGTVTISRKNLAMARAQKYPGNAEPSDSPAWRRVLVPGRTGSPDVPAYVIDPDPANRSKPALLHMHGGGYVFGNAVSQVPDLQIVARELGCLVVTVDYRLAPETPYPGALEDNYAALLWLFRQAVELGVDPTRIAIKGESAGGGHAAMLAIAARDRGEVPLCAQVLVYPMLDDRTGSTRHYAGPVGQFIWNEATNRFGWSALLGDEAGGATAPKGAVPARETNVAGLPATFIGVGSIDLFVHEDIVFASRLMEAGVLTELLVLPGCYHAFDLFVPEARSSREFRHAWMRFLRDRFLVDQGTSESVP